MEQARRLVQQVQGLGCRFALDDFGAVDGSFIFGIDAAQGSYIGRLDRYPEPVEVEIAG